MQSMSELTPDAPDAPPTEPADTADPLEPANHYIAALNAMHQSQSGLIGVTKDVLEGKKLQVLTAYARHGVLSRAARECGVSEPLPFWWAKHDPAFAQAVRDLAPTVLSNYEAAIYQRAVVGVDKPLYWQGKLTGDTIKEYSDNLLMFRTKRLDPEYRDTAASVHFDVHLETERLRVEAEREGLDPDAVEAEFTRLLLEAPRSS